MVAARMPEEFYDQVAHHLPPEQTVGRKGGRPPIQHRKALRVIWLVLATGCRWEDVPVEMGCSGRTAARRLRAWELLGVWARLHAELLGALKRAGKLDADTVVVDGVTVRAFGGGEATGPSPVDRGRKGDEAHPGRGRGIVAMGPDFAGESYRGIGVRPLEGRGPGGYLR
ncbi:transposase [Paludisphaera mucosa]|uniref:Transposase n=1 Tax=Paludisphaera mucosa TaxID=3030827 RepID=A0ABT6FJB0_9BACT|nr:transposase [Paludisphaera mucosa]MDG3007480.1 transposase [Paludisphaera mucosa]